MAAHPPQGRDRLKFCCRCSMLEIYNEVITDLLNPSATNLQARPTALLLSLSTSLCLQPCPCSPVIAVPAALVRHPEVVFRHQYLPFLAVVFKHQTSIQPPGP